MHNKSLNIYDAQINKIALITNFNLKFFVEHMCAKNARIKDEPHLLSHSYTRMIPASSALRSQQAVYVSARCSGVRHVPSLSGSLYLRVQ